MSKFKHLFFDLDNTILDFSSASHKAFDATLRHFQYQHTDSYSIYSVGNALVWQEFEEGKISAEVLRGKRFQVFLDKMGWNEDGVEWNRYYLQELINHIHFVEGAQNLVTNLSNYFQIHIVTNGLKEVQRPRLEKAGLTSHLSSITVSDEIGHAKPQSGFFEVATENAGVSDLSSVLMIGDSYRSDIQGAASFGLSTCWYNPGKSTVDSQVHDFEIHRLQDLEQLVL